MPSTKSAFFSPWLTSWFGFAVSIVHFLTVPSGCLTSTWIQPCGFTHSILARVPANVSGLLASYSACLLYTSDAADERSSVDLGGRRIIKKKKKKIFFFFFQAEDGIRDAQESRGLGDVYKRQILARVPANVSGLLASYS